MAQLHMDAISDTELLKFSEVRNALLSLPTGLNDSYDKAMERIQHHGKLLLKLVSYACRPLKIKEVEHALGMTPGDDEILDEEIVPASTLVSRCAGLVTLNEGQEVVFSHYTVENYFTTRRNELFESGQIYMTEICLHYLNLKEFQNGPVRGEEEGALFEARLTNNPFFEYASIFWGTHAKACEIGSALDLASKFIRDDACRNASIQALWYSSEGATNHWRNRNSASPLHLAMYFKYAELANRLLEEGADANFQESFGMTTLMWAAQVGDLEMAKKTIHMKVPLEAVNTHGESALYIAIEKGHEDVANLLIAEPLLDVNLPCKRGETQEITPLNFAIAREEVCIVQKLLTRDDISTNSIDKHGWSIVHWAAFVGDPRIMEAVVGIPGIDLNCPNPSGVPPLITVAYNGNLASLVALLDAGANINVFEQDPGQRGTALMRAADADYIAIVHELLKRRIDWEATDLENRNAVHSAAINGSLRSLSALLDVPKIDMNLQDVYGNTPMHDAAALSDPRALKILLDKGAHSKVPNHRGKSPLDMARAKGCKINVKNLKDKYAEDFGMPRRSLTGMSLEEPTLIEAAQQGDKSAVNSILTAYEQDKSIDIEETDDWLGRTPLQHAVHCGSLSIVRKLYKAGASITVQDKYGRTPLHIAALLNRYKIAGYLVSRGADPRVKDRWGVSAIEDAACFLQVFFLERDIEITPSQNREILLFWAAELGSMKALKCLVDAGVEVQVKDDYGHSPYEIARQSGQMEAAKYLDRVGKGTTTSAISLPRLVDKSDRAKTPIATTVSKSNNNIGETQDEGDDRTHKDHESKIDYDNNSAVYGSKTPAEEDTAILKRKTSKIGLKDSLSESSQTLKAIEVFESSKRVGEFARKWLQTIIILFLLLIIYHLK